MSIVIAPLLQFVHSRLVQSLQQWYNEDESQAKEGHPMPLSPLFYYFFLTLPLGKRVYCREFIQTVTEKALLFCK